MNNRKKIIITVVTVIIVAVVLATIWLIMGTSTKEEVSNKSGSSSGQSADNEPTADDIRQKLSEDTNTIINDNKLSDREKRDKTIEVMETAKKKYEEIGDANMITEITANIELVRSWPINEEKEQAGGDSQPTQPGREN